MAGTLDRRSKLDVLPSPSGSSSAGSRRAVLGEYALTTESAPTGETITETSFVIADNSLLTSIIAASCTCSSAFDVLHPWQNILSGAKYPLAKTVSTCSTIQFDFKLAEATPANYFILSYIINIAGNTVEIFTSDDGSTYTSQATGTIETINNDDYFLEFTEISAQYWRVVLTASSSMLWSFGRMFIGQFLDLQCEPDNYNNDIDHLDKYFITDSGTVYSCISQIPKFKLTTSWLGVSDELTATYEKRIVNKQSNLKVFLVARNYTKLLLGGSLYFCKVESASKTKPEGVPNWNQLDASFVEVSI